MYDYGGHIDNMIKIGQWNFQMEQTTKEITDFLDMKKRTNFELKFWVKRVQDFLDDDFEGHVTALLIYDP